MIKSNNRHAIAFVVMAIMAGVWAIAITFPTPTILRSLK